MGEKREGEREKEERGGCAGAGGRAEARPPVPSAVDRSHQLVVWPQVVPAVMGLSWYDCTVTGMEAHAGPTPMHLRRDALQVATRIMQEIYQEPVKPELIAQRVEEIKATGAVVCGSLTPQKVREYYEVALEAGLDILVVQAP